MERTRASVFSKDLNVFLNFHLIQGGGFYGSQCLGNEELRTLWSSHNIRVIGLRSIRWQKHAACMIEMRNIQSSAQNLKERHQPEVPTWEDNAETNLIEQG
jgi:hypothetical protein